MMEKCLPQMAWRKHPIPKKALLALVQVTRQKARDEDV